MDILQVVSRCAQAEKVVASIYEQFAERFREDPALQKLWSDLAAEERRHSRSLSNWKRLLELERPDDRPREVGFATSLKKMEGELAPLRQRAQAAASAEEAFGIALDLEASELDSLYVELLQCSPLHRFPDLDLTSEAELGEHRRRLVAAIRSRTSDESLRLRAELLALGSEP